MHGRALLRGRGAADTASAGACSSSGRGAAAVCGAQRSAAAVAAACRRRGERGRLMRALIGSGSGSSLAFAAAPASPRPAAASAVAAAAASSSRVPVADSPMRSLDEPWPGDAGAAAADSQRLVAAMRLERLGDDLPDLLVEMGIRYDPDKLAAVLERRRAQVYGRAVRIAASLGGFIAKVAGDYALGGAAAATAGPTAAARAAELRALLSGLGPSFVKIGQALSARPDLLPQVYLEALADLQVCCGWCWGGGDCPCASACRRVFVAPLS